MNKKSEVLIVFAHPSKEGHNVLIFNNVKKLLKEKNLNYSVVDLYKDKFNPVLEDTELYTQGKRELSKQVFNYQNLIKEHEKLIFIFPIWWNGPPAILKGFFDKVLTGRFAFTYKEITRNLFIPIKLLIGKKAAVFYTTGSPKIAFEGYLGGRGRKVVCKDILGFCGIKSKGFILDNAKKIDENTQTRVSKLVNNGFNWLLK
ncbi:NAD(P)H-dependent oxidoreductase [Candidatus Woesearchaeota archaeon]|nr:NAD(P)H-dependent oxidoreductase [Candidatus Woesearchaeota archaeon]